MLNLLVHDDMLLKPSRLNFSRPGELFDMVISCSKASRTTARHTATVSGRWIVAGLQPVSGPGKPLVCQLSSPGIDQSAFEVK